MRYRLFETAVLKSCLMLAAITTFVAPTAAQPVERPEIRMHGSLIHVPDLDQATAFFRERTGFSIRSANEAMVELEANLPVYLVPSASAERRHQDREEHVAITFQTADIETRSAAWREAGVEFLEPAPSPNGVGVSIRWHDPFGIRYSLLEQRIAPSPPFEEPHIYNVGFFHADIPDARAFYVDLLGFAVRSESYYPPAIPLGHEDGSFAFMLHEDLNLSPPLRPGYDGAGVSIVFQTPDMSVTRAYLEAAGVPIETIDPVLRSGRQAITIRDPAGIQSEIWELPPLD